MELGKLGIWTTWRRIGESNAGEAASLVEDLGYTAFWLGGSPRLPSVRAAARGDREARDRDEHREHLGLRSGRARRRVRGARAGLPGTPARGHRNRPSRGDERLHEAAHRHADVPRRPRWGRRADSARAPLHRGAGAEDAGAERRALARHDPVLRPGRAHESRARAARARPARGPGGRGGGRQRYGAGTGCGARVRLASTSG